MTRLFQKMAAGEMGLGVWLKSGPTWVSTIARGGFDFVRPDMMFSAMDWRDLDHILRCAQAAGITCWVRIAANPWQSGTGQMQVTVDVQRAFAIGVPIVGVSVASAEQARACFEVSKDWHRSGTGEYPSSNETWTAMSKQKDPNQAMFVPHIEAATSIDEVEKILSIEGLRVVMVAMTDLSDALGYPFQYDHPEVWKVLDAIVKKAHSRGLIVAANSGYAFTTPQQIVARVRKMHEHGVRICLMQGADSMYENFAKSLLTDVRGALS